MTSILEDMEYIKERERRIREWWKREESREEMEHQENQRIDNLERSYDRRSRIDDY